MRSRGRQRPLNPACRTAGTTGRAPSAKRGAFRLERGARCPGREAFGSERRAFRSEREASARSAGFVPGTQDHLPGARGFFARKMRFGVRRVGSAIGTDATGTPVSGSPGVAWTPGSPTKKAPGDRGLFREIRGGADGDRTHDLHDANVALSQLSYRPTEAANVSSVGGGSPRADARSSAGQQFGQAVMQYFAAPPCEEVGPLGGDDVFLQHLARA